MAEKIAEIEVKLNLNDREYTSSAKNAEKATEALDESVEKLSENLEEVGDSAEEAGEDLEKMGKKAKSTRSELSGLRKEAKSLMSLGGFAGLLGGGAVGAYIKSAWDASAANAANMQKMGLAAGGNQSMFGTMTDLYRQINSASPISREDAANISAQVTKRFGFLSEGDRAQLASRLAAAAEGGEDTNLIMKSMEKIAKSYGGEFNASKMLDMLNYTANQTNDTLANVAATTAALARTGKANKIDAGTMQQFLLRGYQQGNDLPQTAESILRGIETTNTANAQLRPSARLPVWMGVSQSEFANTAIPSVGYLSPDTGLVPTPAAETHRQAQLITKELKQAMGDLLDNIMTRPKEYIGDYLHHNFDTMLRDVYGGEENYARMRRGEFGMPPNVHPGREGSVIQPIINQYFTSSDSPTVAAQHAAQNEAARWARR